MKVLIIGNGSKEHALIWKLKQESAVRTIYCAPGNSRISRIVRCVPIKSTNIEGLLNFADEQRIDLTIVGPELPLALGIVDVFQAQNLTIFGPTKKAAAIVGSHQFAKYLTNKYNIPTSNSEIFDDVKSAENFLIKAKYPIIVKAESFSDRKRSIVCLSKERALYFLDQIMNKHIFGNDGNKIVFEEYLTGTEFSILVLTDGIETIPFVPVRTYRKILDGDKGHETAGMGACAHELILKPHVLKEIYQKIVSPVIRGFALENRPFRGLLQCNLVFTNQGFKVKSFNISFSDPETQVILPLVKSNLCDILLKSSLGKLNNSKIELKKSATVCVFMAATGYPGKFEIGKKILGLDRKYDDNLLIFHEGTKQENNTYKTQGGRILAITAIADTTKDARKKAYHAVGKITYDGAYYRKDIAQDFI